MKNRMRFKTSLKKILIIDDETDILEIVKYILIRKGFDVYTHTSGLEILEAVEFYNPDLILLDIGLPGKSGTEVCQELKRLYRVPIILFSALLEMRQVYKEYEADGFIGKPVNIVELMNSVNACLN